MSRCRAFLVFKRMGGYTMRVLRDMLSPAERVEFDKSVPFVID